MSTINMPLMKKKVVENKFSILKHVTLTLLLWIILTIGFFLIMLPFLTRAEGLSFEQAAIVGNGNILKIVFFYGFLTAIFAFFSFWKKFFRITTILLFFCWIAGTSLSLLILLAAPKSPKPPQDSNHVISNTSACNEKETLSRVKNCSLLVMRDDGGHGTGFSIYSGYLITNKHVIENATSLTTWINSEKPLTVWNYSPVYDIAILKLPESIHGCKWFNSDQMSTAETVYTVGWPLNPGGESTISKGIFSRMDKIDNINYIQTDASINSGNSGGPLANSCGIVGINTSKIEKVGVEGMSFSLPSTELIPIVEKLIAEGKHSMPIPKTSKQYFDSSSDVPSSNYSSINVNNVKEYQSKVYEAKNSWKNCRSCNRDDLNKLLDSFERQIVFCQTLLDRLDGNKIPSQDDLFMWDSVIKLSYETAALAKRLNGY